MSEVMDVKIADLVELGLLSPPEKLHGFFDGKRINGKLNSDGAFVCGGVVSGSPSVAAGQAITALSGRTSPSRAYWSVNGWQFWHVTGGEHAGKTLADLRGEFLERKKRKPRKS